MVSANNPVLVSPSQATPLNLSWPLILLVGLTLVRGLFYLSIFPPFLAPDESAHFEAIRLIGQEKKWPTAVVYWVTPMHPEMVPTFEKFRLWELVNLYSPPENLGFSSNLFIDYYPTQIAASPVVADAYLMLYHVTLAPLSAATASLDLTTQVYLLRFVSVLFAAGTIIIAWFTVRSIFPQEPALAVAVGSFITLWPMHTHVDASITVDPLAELLASAFFLVLVKIWLKGFSPVRAILLLASLALAFLTKPTTFFLLPTLGVAVLIYLGWRLKWPALLTGGTLALLAGATLLISILLHENSGGGRKLLALFSTPPILPDWSSYITSEALQRYVQSLNFGVLSFAGLFGWSNIHIPWMWVRIWAGLLFLILVGGLIFMYQHLLPRTQVGYDEQQRNLLLIFLLALVFSFIGVMTPIIANQSSTWSIHSRYYFPAVIPLALYFFLSFRQLFSWQWRKFVLPAWVIGWFTYDSLVLLVVVLPYLYS